MFSKEPIAWLGAAIVVLQVATGVIQDRGITVTGIEAILTVIATITGRKLVSPVGK
jgi:hypothetical protein